MTGFVTEQSDIVSAFETAWNFTRIAHDNEQFDPQSLTEYVRITDNKVGGRQASLGDNPLYRYRGIVTVQVFVKPNIGTARSMALCDNVTPIFRSARIGQIQFQVPYPVVVGNRDGWYQVNVICPYYRDEE